MIELNWQLNWDQVLAVLPNGNVGFYKLEVLEHLKICQKKEGQIDYNFLEKNHLKSFEVDDLDNFHTAAPLITQIEITNRCNLTCQHCYAFSGPNEKRENVLSKDEIFNIIDQLDDMGALSVFLTGGEVFTHPNCVDIINYANEKKFINQVFTNGILIREEHLQKIKRPTIFAISFDTALDESSIRGGMDYKKLSEKVNLLKKYGHSVRLSLSVHKGNLDELLNVYQWCYDQNISSPQWIETLSTGRALKNPNILLTIDDLPKAKQIYAQCLILGKKIEAENNYSKVGLIQFCTLLEQATLQEKCGRTFVYINSQGDVYPCANCMSNCEFGEQNIRYNSFKNIWKNGFKEMRRIKFQDFEECQSCPVEKAGIWCQFKCPPLSKNLTSSYTGCGATQYLKEFMLYAFKKNLEYS